MYDIFEKAVPLLPENIDFNPRFNYKISDFFNSDYKI
jgi:hypothetical protein